MMLTYEIYYLLKSRVRRSFRVWTMEHTVRTMDGSGVKRFTCTYDSTSGRWPSRAAAYTNLQHISLALKCLNNKNRINLCYKLWLMIHFLIWPMKKQPSDSITLIYKSFIYEGCMVKNFLLIVKAEDDKHVWNLYIFSPLFIPNT